MKISKKILTIILSFVILCSLFIPFSQTTIVNAAADVAIVTNIWNTINLNLMRAGPFWTSPTVGYDIYITRTNPYIVYKKTTDGGANYGAEVSIRASGVKCVDCYADWQVAGDAGTKIHITYIDYTSKELRYCYLDTSTDTVGGDDLIVSTLNPDLTWNWTHALASICKTRGGNIAVAASYRDGGDTNHFYFYTSPDGDTWTSRGSPWEGVNDWIQLYPGNYADNNDLDGIFWDRSEAAISLKTFDNSANTWSEAAISSATHSDSYLQFDGQVRLSDGHLILAFWNLYDNAAADLQVWDINGSGSITALTNIISNEAESFGVSVFVNQVNNDLYVAYMSGSAALATVQVFYQKSTDGGANWGGETVMMADAEDDIRWVSAGCMKASLGGRFEPFWFNDDTNDLLTNVENGVTLAALNLSIDLDTNSWAIGTVIAGETKSTGLTAYTVTNNGTVTVDIKISGIDMTGTGVTWDLADDGNAGAATYGLKAGLSGESYNIIVRETATYNFLKEDLAVSGTQVFGLQLYTPTSGIGSVAMSGTVTLTASQAF